MATSQPPAVSGLPIVGQTVRFVRDSLGMSEEIRSEYGPVARVSLLGVGEFYHLAHPEALEQALVTQREAFGKSEDFRIAFGENLLSTEGDQWRRQRDALEEFFYPARIREYADRIVDATLRRLDRWRDGERRSLHEELSGAALDNFFAALFDRRLDPDGDQRLRRAAADINRWFKTSSFALPRWVPTPARRRFRAAIETVEDETRRMLAERKREGTGDDLLSTLVELQEREDAGLTDDEIVDQVVGLVFAGHDTTALAMTYALHQLGTHDDVRDRFHAELDDVLGGDRPTFSDLGSLPVTERIVNETLRLYPPVHTIPRRTTRHVTVHGHDLDPDTRAHLSVWAVHRDGTFWDDPAQWRPSRWHDTSPRDAGFAFVPFGAGPRVCIGRRFALLEAKLVLALVGQRFELAPDRPLAFDPMTTTQPAHGVPARIRER